MSVGKLYVISAPSGAGKTSLVKALVESTKYIKVSISHTTRAMRPGEKNGLNYYYISKGEFAELIEKKSFLEYAEVFDNYYGTSASWVNDQLVKGVDIILEIDWQGARQIREKMPESVSIFILPPTLDTLRQRLIARKQDKADIINQRMAQAISEMSNYVDFDYTIINDEFDLALRDLQTIIRSNRLLTSWIKLYKKSTIDALLNSK